MPLDVAKVKKLLAAFEFKPLFIEELGWNLHNAKLDILVDGQTYTLTAVAKKCGMAAFVCSPGHDGHIPDNQTRRKIERHVAKSIHEHLIIFVDVKQTIQRWQWVRRERGKPAACREHLYHAGQPGDSLIQKLQLLAISLKEEESITLPDVTIRVKGAFDVERVTKRFYDLFKTEHETFLKFLKGIPDEEMERWYVSVMLNRLMFIYFVQKKGFLNSDREYLKNKLTQCKKELGKDRYYSDFLCPLFFEGFARRKEERSDKFRKLLGEVPYLNGGIFMPHQIEQIHGKAITIPDKAFEQLFAFFDAYQWHLDERPLKRDNEINPDVLGYIFEKYINQKQMGAYYTKEDITGYISKNTIIPFLFDKAREKCKVAFEGERSIWRLLQEDPDGYIYPAVAQGVVWDARQTPAKRLERPFDLPSDIAAGIPDVSKRTDWNKPASSEYALPTEIWREVVARRKRYEEVRGKIAAGEVRSINDCITYNLDIRQFAQDVIGNCEGPELLVAFWKAVEAVTVLDPTCGSGAFLFAALNILEPLYEACLDRMQFFLEEWGEVGKKHHPNYYKLFSETLKRVDDHPNHKYFVLKSIIVNNLYGVDIMEEAVEICKLRLFLKLVAQVERLENIEPLPDIDFNIRAGNTLVGYSSLEELKNSMEGDWIKLQELPRIEESALIADRAFQIFRKMQTECGMSSSEYTKAKKELRDRLTALENEVNRYLAVDYGVKIKNSNDFEKWKNSHRPFHWYIEFFGILKAGGFDIIIGNPPYVEYSKVKSEYSVPIYQTEGCGNIYAYTIERSLDLLSAKGLISLIVPLSLMSTERMKSLQSLLLQENRTLWLSAFDVYPCKLFEGAKQRLTIFIVSSQTKDKNLLATRYNRWKPEERDYLFPNLEFWPSYINKTLSVIPKIGNCLPDSILRKIERFKSVAYVNGGTHVSFYVHRIPYNYVKAFDFIPYFYNEIDGEKKSEDYKPYYIHDQSYSKIMLAVLNSNLFFWWWYTLFEGYHCGKHEIYSFPAGLDNMSHKLQKKLIELADVLMKDIKKNKNRKNCSYKNTGKVIYDEFYPRKSKAIIDRIDFVLSEHYGLSMNETDYIINYDIKYRTGTDDADFL